MFDSISYLIPVQQEPNLLGKDADYFGVLIRNLPPDTTFISMGGGVRGYLLQQCTLIFKSNIGRYDLSLGNLGVSDFETIDGRQCPVLPSVLGLTF